MIAYIFPGQGSQKKGMGKELFDSIPEFYEQEDNINSILGYSLRELCLANPGEKLKQTQYTQPCLFIANALNYYQEKRKGGSAKFVAGHSLGEYNALLAAGCFDLLTGLLIVKKRGELMAKATNGGMAAVIGLESTKIESEFTKASLDSIDIANFNSPNQTVISGPVADIEKANEILKEAGARMCITLPVSAAFHSRYMNEAAEHFDEFLREFTFNTPKINVIANVTGKPYSEPDSNSEIRSLLVKQIDHSVRWIDSVRYMLNQGVGEFIELGPGNVLTGLIQQIRTE